MFDKKKWLKRFRQEHPEVLAEWQHRHYLKNRETILAKHRAQNKRARDIAKLEVLSHYSGGIPKCECCGETGLKFLSLDHQDNDGRSHRQKYGVDLYLKLKRLGFPSKPRLRVLCFNCNLGRNVNKGICPHKDRA